MSFCLLYTCCMIYCSYGISLDGVVMCFIRVMVFSNFQIFQIKKNKIIFTVILRCGYKQFQKHSCNKTTFTDIRLHFALQQRIPKCIIPYPTAFPYGNGMVLHFYQQQESSTTKTVNKVINKGLKTYV